jgi:ribose 5-phosphate isomerase B
VARGQADRGIVIGGTGSGEVIACNKIPGVRAGLCHELLTTEISRAHNDSNVMVLGAMIVGPVARDGRSAHGWATGPGLPAGP